MEELTLLLKTCKEHKNPNVYLAVYLAVYLGVLTAARATMILNIRKKDINVKTHEIKLNNYKGDKKYRLTLNRESIEWLDKKFLQHINPDDYLIRSTNKHYLPETPQPLSEMPDAIYEIMDELFNQDLNKQNNSDREDVINFHSIRRTVATNLAEQGTSIYDIMVLLDHSSIKQNKKIDAYTIATERLLLMYEELSNNPKPIKKAQTESEKIEKITDKLFEELTELEETKKLKKYSENTK